MSMVIKDGLPVRKIGGYNPILAYQGHLLKGKRTSEMKKPSGLTVKMAFSKERLSVLDEIHNWGFGVALAAAVPVPPIALLWSELGVFGLRDDGAENVLSANVVALLGKPA